MNYKYQSPIKFKYVGKPMKRVDAMEKVTGSAKFVTDMFFPNMLYAAVKRSPIPHGIIKRIDVSKAKTLPGVRAIVTGKDVPYRQGIYLVDRPIITMDRVRYVGEPVAAVAADTLEIARQAVELIEVEYEELPVVQDPRESMKGEILIHPDLANYERLPIYNIEPEKNVFHHHKTRKGDVEKGFKEADLIVEGDYSLPQIYHAPLEPHAAIAYWDLGGRLTVWSSAQSPFTLRNLIAHAFKIPRHKVRVIAPYVGGGFGGKAGINMEGIVIALAEKIKNRHIKLVYTREEDISAVVRQGMYAHIKTGVKKDGTIVAMEATLIFDGGAYAEYGTNVVRAAGYTLPGGYYVPNLKTDSYGVYTNHFLGGAFRGFGHSELHWATERNLDEVAQKLGMDPLELRLKNVLKPGLTNSMGQKIHHDTGNMEACLKKAAELIEYGKKSTPSGPRKVRGKGIAGLVKAPAMPTNAGSSVIIKFTEDATVTLQASIQEIGQGFNTAIIQMAADALHMSPDKIHFVTPNDTDFNPYEWQTVASRALWTVGNALYRAAEDALNQIKNIASQVLGVAPHNLEVEDDRVFVKYRPEVYLLLKDVVMGYTYPDGHAIGGPVIGRGSFVPEMLTNLDLETGQGNAAAEWTFGAEAAEVEIDLDTGEITIIQLVGVFDAGTIINPITAGGQVIGGMIQGMGPALFEVIKYNEKGYPLTVSFTDYKIPTIADIPENIKYDFVETFEESSPFGAKGVGEHPMISVPPAIASAIYDALGINLRELPLTPEKILEAIERKNNNF
ncbi:xanthine dehydrogenase family protein molybdopterin-binding subunit [Thermosipho atlanticus]|uniref:Xanthine dehydrogenase, molybdenum binding subunit apoprotein n=1 Tax=Thermosipho atlanticus DSM 15807 TaxID=1123380 RepID=A0A1M5SIZ1_9BACT|nr:xanthine dehydrogenase family protein molybdopterin-binding subunit [Thermosipho atlanticus]SHH38435.1 xanthine dehydrogenase, molybdenum binding subunit apoprotein [Thermosipho atlanticus DSM 15807]